MVQRDLKIRYIRSSLALPITLVLDNLEVYQAVQDSQRKHRKCIT